MLTKTTAGLKRPMCLTTQITFQNCNFLEKMLTLPYYSSSPPTVALCLDHTDTCMYLTLWHYSWQQLVQHELPGTWSRNNSSFAESTLREQVSSVTERWWRLFVWDYLPLKQLHSKLADQMGDVWYQIPLYYSKKLRIFICLTAAAPQPSRLQVDCCPPSWKHSVHYHVSVTFFNAWTVLHCCAVQHPMAMQSLFANSVYKFKFYVSK